MKPDAQTPTPSDGACEVPLIEQLRSIPLDYRTCREIQWAEDGRCTGHQFIPVGYMMRRAADELTAERERGRRVREETIEECAKKIDELRAQIVDKDGWDMGILSRAAHVLRNLSRAESADA